MDLNFYMKLDLWRNSGCLSNIGRLLGIRKKWWKKPRSTIQIDPNFTKHISWKCIFHIQLSMEYDKKWARSTHSSTLLCQGNHRKPSWRKLPKGTPEDGHVCWFCLVILTENSEHFPGVIIQEILEIAMFTDKLWLLVLLLQHMIFCCLKLMALFCWNIGLNPFIFLWNFCTKCSLFCIQLFLVRKQKRWHLGCVVA